MTSVRGAISTAPIGRCKIAKGWAPNDRRWGPFSEVGTDIENSVHGVVVYLYCATCLPKLHLKKKKKTAKQWIYQHPTLQVTTCESLKSAFQPPEKSCLLEGPGSWKMLEELGTIH